jgi:hypothetical protein
VIGGHLATLQQQCRWPPHGAIPSDQILCRSMKPEVTLGFNKVESWGKLGFQMSKNLDANNIKENWTFFVFYVKIMFQLIKVSLKS